MQPEEATVADIPRMVDIWFECFSQEPMIKVWPDNAIGRAHLAEAFERFLDPSQSGRIAIIRNQDGIRSVIMYFYEVGGVMPLKEKWPPIHEGQDAETFEMLFTGLEQMHKLAMGTQDHIYIETVMTAPAAQRQGMATALLKYAAEKAGAQPSFLNSEKDAQVVYKRAGFEPVDMEQLVGEIQPMMKPGKV